MKDPNIAARLSSAYSLIDDEYLGRHRFSVDPVLGVRADEVTLAPLGADDRWEIGDGYEPRHAAAEVER